MLRMTEIDEFNSRLCFSLDEERGTSVGAKGVCLDFGRRSELERTALCLFNWIA